MRLLAKIRLSRENRAAYPVNLVQVVRFEHDTADNTGARSGLHLDLDGSVEEVVLGLDGGRVTLLGDGEASTLAVIVNGTGGDLPVIRSTSSEVGVHGGAHARVGGAGCIWLAITMNG